MRLGREAVLVGLALWLFSTGELGCGGGTSERALPGDRACEGKAPICVKFCGTDMIESATCEHGNWQCRTGTMFLDDCPSDTCTSAPSYRCCDALGNQENPTCPNHGMFTCRAGFTLVDGFQGCTKPPGCEQYGCATDRYCHYANGNCSGTQGECVTPPTTCAADDAPVCGCDGVIYANECEAEKNRVNLGQTCNLTGFHLCGGFRLCHLGAEYCEVTGSIDPSVTCKPLPAGCGDNPTCACLADEPCGDKCSAGSTPGWIKLSCVN